MLEEAINKWLGKLPFDIGVNAVSNSETLFAIATDIGPIRKENQDRVAAIWVNGGRAFERSFLCVAVCDGMGGMKDGATSATIAISSFFAALVHQRGLPVADRLHSATETANRAVYERVRGGGATLSAALFEDETAHLVNVGDSRIYTAIGSGEKARLERATKDDNMKEVFGAEGEGLLQYIGMGEGLKPHVRMPLLDFGSLLITTDGAHAVGDETLAQIYFNAETPSEAAERLTALARWMGGQDNATVALITAAALDYPTTGRQDAEIVLWSPFGQFQIAWATPPKEMPPQPESLPTQPNEMKASKRGKNNPKRSGKPKGRKAKQTTKEKVQFDFGIEATEDEADS